jgi:hypothetical protein
LARKTYENPSKNLAFEALNHLIRLEVDEAASLLGEVEENRATCWDLTLI